MTIPATPDSVHSVVSLVRPPTHLLHPRLVPTLPEISMESEQPLLPTAASGTIDGAVDYSGRPVLRSTSGGWNSALFIIGVEIAERFAYYGVAANLITYLTGALGQSTAVAAANVNAWSGAASMLPLLGAIVADSWLGRYKTIVAASILYVVGLAMLTLSAVAPSLHPSNCSNGTTCSPTNFQVAFFFFSIYLVSFAQGGHKPCVQAFGADQFDGTDPAECKSKSSFFNWWYFGMCCGTSVTLIGLSYVQDNVGWGFGFGFPCVAMVLALIIFLLGTKTYRYYGHGHKNPFAIISGVGTGISKHDAMTVLKLFPIWATCLIYAVVFAQSTTFFTKQGSTMDRRIGTTFLVPPAALQSFISFAVVSFIPIYDRVLVPIARKFTGLPSGLSMLQRIGTGMLLSVISMVIAALVEKKRLQVADDFGLIDLPNATIPMSLWWLVPQYILFGISDVFTMVGLQEFFYDQVPSGLRSIGLSLYLSIFGLGSFISSFLVSVIDKVSRNSGESWFSDNLNRAHLDYFYWVLAALSTVGLLLYWYFSHSFVYKTKISVIS